MPKSRTGGRRAATPAPQQQVQQPQQQVLPLTDQQIEDGVEGFLGNKDEFDKMTSDEKAQAILDSLDIDTPSFLSDSALQKLAFAYGLDQRPTVVSDAQLDAIKGTAIYRQVNNVYDRVNDLNFTSDSIAKQVLYGDYTRYSDSGGSAYGQAVYFGDSYREVRDWYGTGGTERTMFRAKINPKARTGNYNTVESQMQTEIRRGTKLGRALKQVDYRSQLGVYCMAKGYDALIDNSSGYYMIYNRSALVISNDLRKNTTKATW